MKLRKLPGPPVRANSIVWDTPSNLGGTYTVQIVAEDGDRRLVQTIYGSLNPQGTFAPWDDCLEFWTTADQLTNRREFRAPTPKAKVA